MKESKPCYNGMLNVYKEKGFTSHDVVAKLRGICHQKKIGHTGTLDPDAEGVLPVCLGTATKVCELLTDKDKEYRAVLLLGQETDTQDISGTVLAKKPVFCSEQEILKVIDSFTGVYNQIPPMYSALKVNGRKLCDLARAGIEVERRPRPVQIYEIAVLRMELPRVWLRVHCSKGTYIRTLCRDIGAKLGCGGCMEELLRTRVGVFGIEDSLRLAELEDLAKTGCIGDHLLRTDCLFMQYPAAGVRGSYRRLLENGNRLPVGAFFMQEDEDSALADQFRVYLDEEQKDFFGIYAKDEAQGDYRPLKIFWQRN